MTDVITELATAAPNEGAAAGVPMEVYRRFVDSTDKVDRVRKRDRACKGAPVRESSRRMSVESRNRASRWTGER
ncbi:MAG: hypothetical protein ABI134_26135 [Byssovorax sp.]